MRRGRPLLCVCLLLAAPAWAWNPIDVRDDAPLRWETTQPIVWNPDLGPLGNLDNATATAMVADGLAVWQSVPTASIAFAEGAAIVDATDTPVDVTADNFLEVVELSNGQNPVIFDNDQQIWALLGVSSSVLGFAGQLETSGSTIVKGFVALQGAWVDGVTILPPNCGNMRCNPELSDPAQFLNIVVHELGHFVGLGHTTVNRLVDDLDGCAQPGVDKWATMNPFAHFSMETLHQDDRVGLSVLYPTPAFPATGAALSGRVMARDGRQAFDGANVVLRPDTTDCDRLFDEAQAMQSGVDPAETGGAGGFRFDGLTPGDGYTVSVRSIDEGGSYPIGGSNPPQTGAPDEYYNGPDEDYFDPPDLPDMRTTIVTGVAGSELGGIELRLNNAGGPGGVTGSGADALRLGKLPDGELSLEWGAACNASVVPDQTFAVYAGSLASVGAVQDHVPLTCDTDGQSSYRADATGDDRYFLIVPLIASREGDAGTGSGGRTRDPLATCGDVRPDSCP